VNRLITLVKLATLCCVAFAFVSMGLFALQLRNSVRSSAAKLDAVADESKAAIIEARKNVADTSKQLNVVLLQSSETMNQIRHVSMAERDFAKSANERTLAVLDELERTARSVNDSQKQIARASVAALQSLRPAAETSAQAMQQAAEDLESLNVILRDQNIPATLAHVNDTATHLDSMSTSLDVAVKRWTKPGSFFKSLFLGLLDTSSKVAVIAK
jgi:hypothetical protein